MNTRTILHGLWVGGFLVLMGTVALPAHGQKTITLSAEGAATDGASLSRSAFRNQLANALTIRYDGHEPVQVQVYMTVYEAGKMVKEFWSAPYELAPGESALPEGLVPRDDWFPGGAAASWCFCPVEWLQTLMWGALTGENVAEEHPWPDPEAWRKKQVAHAMHGLLGSSDTADDEDRLVIDDDDTSPFHPCTDGSTYSSKGVGISVVPILEPGKKEFFKIDVAVFTAGDS